MILGMTFHRLLWQASILLLLCTLALPARAVSLLRDADMEYALAQVARSIDAVDTWQLFVPYGFDD